MSESIVLKDEYAMGLLLTDLEAYKGREGYTEMKEKARTLVYADFSSGNYAPKMMLEADCKKYGFVDIQNNNNDGKYNTE